MGTILQNLGATCSIICILDMNGEGQFCGLRRGCQLRTGRNTWIAICVRVAGASLVPCLWFKFCATGGTKTLRGVLHQFYLISSSVQHFEESQQ